VKGRGQVNNPANLTPESPGQVVEFLSLPSTNPFFARVVNPYKPHSLYLLQIHNSNMTLITCMWRENVPPKRRYPSNDLYGITTKQTHLHISSHNGLKSQRNTKLRSNCTTCFQSDVKQRVSFTAVLSTAAVTTALGRCAPSMVYSCRDRGHGKKKKKKKKMMMMMMMIQSILHRTFWLNSCNFVTESRSTSIEFLWGSWLQTYLVRK